MLEVRGADREATRAHDARLVANGRRSLATPAPPQLLKQTQTAPAHLGAGVDPLLGDLHVLGHLVARQHHAHGLVVVIAVKLGAGVGVGLG